VKIELRGSHLDMTEELAKAFKKLRGMCVFIYLTGFVYLAVVYLLLKKKTIVIPQTPAHPMSAIVLGVLAILIGLIMTLSKNRLLSSPPALSDMKIEERQMKAFGLENADPQEAKVFGWFARSSLVLLAIAESPIVLAFLVFALAARGNLYPLGDKSALYFCILIVFGQLLKLTVFPTKQGFLQLHRNLTENE
jgi:xanthosine utilization system XapX-like protein